VQAEFDKRPLDQALKELADTTDTTVVLDGRAADKAKPVCPALARHRAGLGLGAWASQSLRALALEAGRALSNRSPDRPLAWVGRSVARTKGNSRIDIRPGRMSARFADRSGASPAADAAP
jgi:hypothetical protein